MILLTKNQLLKRAGLVLMGVIFTFASYPNVASAAPIMARSVAIGSSAASVSTTYSFNFTVPQTTAVKSISFDACTTASGACVTPAGFSSSASSLSVQPTGLGSASGWTVNTATSGSLRVVNAANAAVSSGSQSVGFSGVVNPSTENVTFFVKITTYSDAAWTTPIDTGTVATSTAGQVAVSVLIDEKLTFTLASTATSLTKPTTSSTGFGTSAMTVSTNAASGYSLSYSGATLTSGVNTIPAMSTQAASAPNSKQFGVNLMANSTPAVGTSVSGTGTGVPVAGYGTANQFKFNTSGDVIATAGVPTNDNTFTTSYIVNADGSTPAGAYSTLITYTAVANF